jgi:alkylation response protein AidB-like acyl-CoA dehydrogenase
MTALVTQELERAELIDAVRRVVVERMPVAKTRTISEGPGFDEEAWRLAGELGWLGLGVPEELGGSGGSFADLAAVLTELGSVAAPGAIFSATVLGIGAVLAAGSEQQQAELLPDLASGTRRMTVALTGASGDLRGPPPARLAEEAGVLSVSGEAGWVFDAQVADRIVVLAQDGDGSSLVMIDGGADGVEVELSTLADVTRRLATVRLNEVAVRPEQVLGERGSAGPAAAAIARRGAVALAVDAVGGMAQALALTVDLVRNREQFGRPVGSFQAVKHHCANMLILLETARVATRRAVAAMTSGGADELEEWCAIAKSYVGDAYVELTRLAVQCHGGVGFTWDFDVHLYLKRARLSQQLYGNPAFHRAQLARLLSGRSGGAVGSMSAGAMGGLNGV